MVRLLRLSHSRFCLRCNSLTSLFLLAASLPLVLADQAKRPIFRTRYSRRADDCQWKCQQNGDECDPLYSSCDCVSQYCNSDVVYTKGTGAGASPGGGNLFVLPLAVGGVAIACCFAFTVMRPRMWASCLGVCCPCFIAESRGSEKNELDNKNSTNNPVKDTHNHHAALPHNGQNRMREEELRTQKDGGDCGSNGSSYNGPYFRRISDGTIAPYLGSPRFVLVPEGANEVPTLYLSPRSNASPTLSPRVDAKGNHFIPCVDSPRHAGSQKSPRQRRRNAISPSPSDASDNRSSGNYLKGNTTLEDTNVPNLNISRQVDRRKKMSPTPSECSAHSPRNHNKDNSSEGKLREIPKNHHIGRKGSPSPSECSDNHIGEGEYPSRKGIPRGKRRGSPSPSECSDNNLEVGTRKNDGNNDFVEVELAKKSSVAVSRTPLSRQQKAQQVDGISDPVKPHSIHEVMGVQPGHEVKEYNVSELFAKRKMPNDTSICDVSTDAGSSRQARSPPMSPTISKQRSKSGDSQSNSSVASPSVESLLIRPSNLRINSNDDGVASVPSDASTRSGRPSLLTVPRRARNYNTEAKLKAELTEVGHQNLQATLQALDFAFATP